jgi:hypothetical protein
LDTDNFVKGLLIISVGVLVRRAMGMQGTFATEPGKKCPACRSSVPQDATKCRYCASDFPDEIKQGNTLSSESLEIIKLKTKNRDAKAYLALTFIPVFIGSAILDVLITGGYSGISGLTFLFTGIGMAVFYSRMQKKNEARKQMIAKLETE